VVRIEIKILLEKHPELRELMDVKKMKFFSIIALNQGIIASELLQKVGIPIEQKIYLQKYVEPLIKNNLITKRSTGTKKGMGATREYRLNMIELGKIIFGIFGTEFEHKMKPSFLNVSDFLEKHKIKTDEKKYYNFIKKSTVEFNEKFGDKVLLEWLYTHRIIETLLNPKKIYPNFRNIEKTPESSIFCIDYLMRFLKLPVSFAVYCYLKKFSSFKESDLDSLFDLEYINTIKEEYKKLNKKDKIFFEDIGKRLSSLTPRYLEALLSRELLRLKLTEVKTTPSVPFFDR
jgi:hypothetical protein